MPSSAHTARLTRRLKARAGELGFAYAGVARAERLDEEARRLEEWLDRGQHGEMAYMANHFDKRVDPTELVPGARSVVCLMYNYFPARTQADPEAPKLARYAYGKDYHHVLKPKLKSLLQFLREEAGSVEGRVFVDSAPVLERDWAHRAGIGWKGKNTLLIHPRAGSYFFLAELIIDLELDPDQPMRDHCGTCRRCIDACPTDAIAKEGYRVDASRCIAYFTIEKRGPIPDEYRGRFENWVFGCDICQEVCPWNRFSTPHREPAFTPSPDLMALSRREWMEITEDVFRELFRGSAVKRAKYEGLRRNLDFLKKSRRK